MDDIAAVLGQRAAMAIAEVVARLAEAAASVHPSRSSFLQ
jgi:hypothetical protein